MRSLFHINDSLANKISYCHLLLLMASLPFNMFYSHIILISYTIHTLIHLNKNALSRPFSLRVLTLQSVFFVTVLSTIYSINKPEAFNEWGKQITIFIIPLLFYLNPLPISKYRQKLLMAFALVCTATIVYLYFDAFITIRHYKLPWLSIFSGPFTHHNFSEPIEMHATFFSMQVLVALTYLVSILIKENTLYKKLFYLGCSIILTAGIIQLSSKSIFIVLFVMINLAVPWFLLKGPARLRFMFVSVAVSVLMIFGVLNSSVFKQRFVTELKLDLVKPTAGEVTDSRLARWSVTTRLISKKPVFGYGAGSEMGLLQDGFYTNKLYDSYLNRLNTHSEYLSILLKSGVIGLLIYLATLAVGFTFSLRQKDLIFFTFMTVVAVVSISENFLDVDKGIIFYAFFFSFFTFSGEGRVENSISEIKRPSIAIPEPGVMV